MAENSGPADSPPVSILVLGPLHVSVNGTGLELRGRQRTLLLALAHSPNRPVSHDSLIRYLWEQDEPANARSSIHWLINRLRAQLGHDAIQTRVDGYQLSTDVVDLDLVEFGRLIDLGERGDAAARYCVLSRALAMWRPPVFEGLGSDVLRRRVEPALTQKWFRALDATLGIDIAEERYEQCIGLLYDLVAEYPLQERFWERLMTCLHRSGRRADALAAYREVLETSRAHLGLDSSHRLAALHDEVLRDEVPHADVRTAQPPSEPARKSRSRPARLAGPGEPGLGLLTLVSDLMPRGLPPAVAPFVGRYREMGELAQAAQHAREIGMSPLIAITGHSGVGKTALATQWANANLNQCGDGHVYLDLRGADPDDALPAGPALHQLLRSVGVQGVLPTSERDLIALLRTSVGSRSILFLLDNARDSEHVVPLLAGGATTTLVTSRSQMPTLVAEHGAIRMPLRSLSPDDSLRLLEELLGAGRVRSQRAAARRLAEGCGHLPLELRRFAERAARFPDTPLGLLAAQSIEAGGRLDACGT